MRGLAVDRSCRDHEVREGAITKLMYSTFSLICPYGLYVPNCISLRSSDFHLYVPMVYMSLISEGEGDEGGRGRYWGVHQSKKEGGGEGENRESEEAGEREKTNHKSQFPLARFVYFGFSLRGFDFHLYVPTVYMSLNPVTTSLFTYMSRDI